MKIERNDKLIKRNQLIAQITTFGSLLIFAGTFIISFRYPDQVTLWLGTLIVGFLISQIGIFFTNRFGPKTRADLRLDQALKGLDKRYTLYHYSSPVRHLLVGPAGVWIVLPYFQGGTISYSKGRYRQKGGNFYMKIFAQESLGRPELEMNSELDSMKRFFKKYLPDFDPPEIKTVMVFTNPNVSVDISDEDQAPAVSVPSAKLKDAIRKSAKAKSLSPEKIKIINDALSE
jgi:hypothetical protein